MGITANSGPFVAYGITVGSSGNVQEYNEERGPSLFDLGNATPDPRLTNFGWFPGQAVGAGATQLRGLWDSQGVVDYIPFAAGSSSITVSSATTPASSVALTLAPISSLGAFQTTIVAPETGKAVSVIAIDSTAQTLNFGTGGTVGIYNPAAGTGRNVLIITSCSATEGYYVRGRDMYGFKMTELVSASTTSTGSGQGKKAFKYIVSVTASSSSTFTSTGVSVGFGDTYGMPLYAPYWNGISIQVSTTPNGSSGLVALTSVNATIGSTAVTMTATTADVRGTWASSVASLGTSANGAGGYNPTSTGVRVTIYQPITANMAAQISLTSNTSAWFGASQFSDF